MKKQKRRNKNSPVVGGYKKLWEKDYRDKVQFEHDVQRLNEAARERERIRKSIAIATEFETMVVNSDRND